MSQYPPNSADEPSVNQIDQHRSVNEVTFQRRINYERETINNINDRQMKQIVDKNVGNQNNHEEDINIEVDDEEKFDNQEIEYFDTQNYIVIEGKEQQEENIRESEPRFSQLHPASEKFAENSSQLSLQYDIKLGWIPKAQITGPIPLAYVHPDSDQIIMQKADKGLVIFYGPRFNNSFAIHGQFHETKNQNNLLIKKYPFLQFHLCKSKFLEAFFRKHYSEYQYDQKRQIGMVKTQRIQPQTLGCEKVPEDQPLIFDSMFEGGNLDAVYYQAGEYRLFLRTDTNTKGHCNYFYFKVKSQRPGNFCFRIMNMSKPTSLYQRGMKPYIRVLDGKDKKWSQSGAQGVRYGQSPLNQEYEDLARKMFSLRFEYYFGNKKLRNIDKPEIKQSQTNLQVQFCYGIPYVYSDLTKFLGNKRQNKNFHLNKLCYSLSGVQIPLVTITQNQPNLQKKEQENQEEAKKKKDEAKFVIALLGRVHPGETHGSHIIQGFIEELLSNSPEAKLLRTHIIFKIIPMLNPDGVIAGNTRTSFSGKDLNRMYSDYTEFVYPQIIGVRDYLKKLKQKYKKKFLFVIDIHGHSTRKNSFFFGPQYPVFNDQYNKCRMLARIFSNITEVFRYYSCKFRLASSKQHTCRGYFNSKNIVRVYTHQTSIHSFFNSKQRQDTPFTQQLLQKLGSDMLKAFHKYIEVSIGIQDAIIPEPVKIKKVKVKKEEGNEKIVQQQQIDSDQMQSDKADSQDDEDDYDPGFLQTFYNKINENKQYFYQELLAANKIQYKKPTKKKLHATSAKKQQQTYSNTKQQHQIKQLNIQSLLVLEDKDTKKKKTQWVPKLEYVNRKKQFLSYENLKNYTFAPPQPPRKKEQPIKQKKKASRKEPEDKYHLVTLSPLKNSILDTTPNLSPTKLQPKISLKKNHSTTRRLSLPQQSTTRNFSETNLNKKKYLYDTRVIQQFLTSHQPLNLITHSQSKLTLSSIQNYKSTVYSANKEQGNTSKLTTNKLDKIDPKGKTKIFIHLDPNQRSQSSDLVPIRRLPRKKSIKSFKHEEELVNKKLAKVKNNEPLTKKLPYLNKLAEKL